ncbi:Large cysteine-rich periplasmic protein OmcB precursor [compost metagenome]
MGWAGLSAKVDIESFGGFIQKDNANDTFIRNDAISTVNVPDISVLRGSLAENNRRGYRNGALINNYSGNGGSISTAIQTPVFLGRLNVSTDPFAGNIAEVMTFGAAHSDTERGVVESYLAVKYGITLSHNYTKSDGVVTYTLTGNYIKDIIGLGREDSITLNQKQSHTPSDSLRVYLSTLAESNSVNSGTVTATGQYLITGHDGTLLHHPSINYNEQPATVIARIQREWKVQNTGFSSTYSFDIKLDAAAATPVTASHLRLLVDDDGDFTNATVLASGESGITISYSGTTVTVAGITATVIPLSSVRYITIGSANCATPLGLPSPQITANNLAAVCPGSTVDLNSAVSTTSNVPAGVLPTFWLDAGAATQPIADPSNVMISNSTTFYAKLTNPNSSCFAIASFNVPVNALPTLIINQVAVSCGAASDLPYVDLTDPGVTTGSSSGIFTYWRDAAASFALDDPRHVTTAGTYYIKLTDDSSCSVIMPYVINASSLLKPTLIITDPVPICHGLTFDLTAASITTGSTAGVQLSYLQSDQTTPVVNPAAVGAAGTYYIQALDATGNGCTVTKPVTLMFKPRPTAADINAGDSLVYEGCEGENVTMYVEASAITDPVFKWYNDAQLTSPINDVVGDGESYVTTIPQGQTERVFYVTVQNGSFCENNAGTAAVITLRTLPNASTTTIQSADTSICKGQAVTLLVSAPTVINPQFAWYDNPDLSGTPVSSSGTYTTPALSSTQQYYVIVSGTNFCTNNAASAKTITVTVKRNATAANIDVSGVNICSGSAVTLTATTSISNPVITWYSDAALTTSVGTGASFNTGNLTNSATYYVTVSGTDVCENEPGSAEIVIVNVKPVATATDIIVSDAETCIGQSTNLSASSSLSNATFNWYSDSNLTTLVATGASVNIPPVTESTTLYVTVSNAAVCQNLPATGKPVVITLNRNATTADIESSDPTICRGTATNLTVTSSVTNPVFHWYTNSTRATLLATGDEFTTPVLWSTQTYFVTVSGDGVCEGPPMAVEAGKLVTVTVNPRVEAAGITAINQSVCEGSSATLTATVSGIANPVFKWYADAGLTQYLSTGADYITPSLNSPRIYYVTVTGTGMCENAPDSAKAVTVTILRNATAADVSVNVPRTCNGTTATLTASSTTISGATFNWYADPGLTTLVGSGTTFITPVLSTTITYYVTASNSTVCANKPNNARVVTVNVLPRYTAATFTLDNAPLCSGNEAIITALTPGVINPLVKWYADQSLTQLLATGVTYKSLPLALSATFYAVVSGDNYCEPTTPFTVNVAVSPLATAADWSVVSNPPACYGSSATVSLASSTISDPVFKWYSDAGYLSLIHTGATFTTPPLTSNTNYYITVASASGAKCENQDGTQFVTVIVNPLSTAADIITQSNSTCVGGTARLSASLNPASTIVNPVFKWYTHSGNTLVNTGPDFTPPIQTIAGSFVSYKVTVSGDNRCENINSYALASLNTRKYTDSTDINVSNQVICSGTNATLTISTPAITGSANQIKIYNDEALTNLLSEQHGLGATYTITFATPVLTSSTNYYITALSNTDCENLPGTAKKVTVVVNPLPNLAINTITPTCDPYNDDGVYTDLTNAAITVGSGAGTFTYWADASATVLLPNPQKVYAGNTYYIKLTDVNGCSVVKPYVFNTVDKPILTITNPVPVCEGTQVDLTLPSITAGSSPGITLSYYTDIAATAAVADPQHISVSGTYYISAVHSSGGCNRIKEVNVVIYPKGKASDITATNTTICNGQIAILTATATAFPSAIINWYSDASLNTLVASGNSYTTPALTSTTNYYLTVSSGDELCPNDPAEAKIVTVNVSRIATPADIDVTVTPTCSGSTTELTAISGITDAQYTWYSDSALTTAVGTGASFRTPALTSSVNYYVTVSGVGVCANSAATAKAVTVTVLPKATANDINASPAVTCNGNTAALEAWTTTVVGPVFKWYSDASLTNLVFTGGEFTTPVLSANTTYYATVSGNGICENEAAGAKSVLVTVNRNSTAADIESSDETICSGYSAELRVSSSVGSPIFKWYADATLNTLLFTGENFTTPPLTSTTSYFVTVSGDGVCEGPGGEVSTGKQITVTVLPKAGASDLTVTGDNICENEQATLTAITSLTNPVIKWYADAGLTRFLASGTTYTPAGLSQTTSFYATVQGDGVCESEPTGAKQATVIVSRHAVANDIQGSGAEICAGGSVQLQVSTSLTNPQFSWFDNAALTGVPITTGNVFNTPALSATTTYYVAVVGDGVCLNRSDEGKALTVKVNRLATASDVSVTGISELCSGSTTTLTANSTTVSNPIFSWYDTADLSGTALYIGTSYTTLPLSSDKTYYVTVTGTGVCANQSVSAKSISIKVNRYATEIDITTNDVQICSNEVANLQASSTIDNPVFKWYDKANLSGVPLATGSNFITPALSVSKIYYVSVSGVGVCGNQPNNGKAVLVSVSRRATVNDIQAEHDSTCYNSGATLIASSISVANAQFKWYTNPDLTGTPLATGATYTTPNLTQTTTYYVSVNGNGVCENLPQAAKPVTLTVIRNATATDISTNNITVCSDEQAILTASSTTLTRAVFKWYNNADLQGTPLHIGTSFTTPPLITTTNYYVSVIGDGACENLPGTGKQVTVTVQRYAENADIVGAGTTICSGSSASLTVTSGSLSAPQFSWYDNAALTGVPLATGASFTTPILTTSTTYYVAATGIGVCKNLAGNGHAVTVNVNRIATATDINALDKTICEGTQVMLTASSSSVINPVFSWYADAALTQLAGTGSSYTTLPLNATTSYYITITGNGVCSNTAASAKVVNVTVTRHATASDITISGTQQVCEGSSTTLTATSSVANAVFRWFDNAGLSGNPISTGAVFNTPMLSTTTTYYATVSGDGVCENLSGTAASIAVVVNRYATALDIAAEDKTLCSGQSINLSASTTTLTNPIFTWYDNAALSGTPVATTSSFTTPALTATTTYYVVVAGDGVCRNKAGTAKEVRVTVNRNAVIADLTSADVTVCNGASALLSAESTVAGAIFKWYAEPSLTNLLTIGDEFTTPPLSSTTTYYVTFSAAGVCESSGSAARPVTVTVNRNGTVADIFSSDPSICSGETTTLTASSSVVNPVFRWYTDASLTTLLTIGDRFTTPALTTSTTYFVTVTGDGVCEGPAGVVTTGKVVTVTVNRHAVNSDITINTPSAICEGTSITLNASTSTIANAVFNWYADAALTQFITSGSQFITPALLNNTTYYVTVTGNGVCENNTGTAASVSLTVNRKAVAADITAAGQTICSGATATLNATSSLTNPVFTWYSDAALTTVVATGVSFTTPALSQTTSYYVTVSGNGVCENEAGAARIITINVNNNATTADIQVDNITVCSGSSATLSASSTTISSPQFSWYSDAALTQLVNTGTDFTTPALTTTTNYFLTVSAAGICANGITDAKQVTVTVNPLADTISISVADQVVCQGSSAVLTASASSINNQEFNWYSDAALNTFISNGATFTTPALTVSSVYYVTVKGDNVCESRAKAVHVTVNRTAVASEITVPDQLICIGQSTTITASAPGVANPSFNWYSDAALTNLISTGVTLNTGTLITSTIYYITVSGDDVCANIAGNAKAVTIGVTPLPVITHLFVKAPTVICSGESTTLSVGVAEANPSFVWYSDAALTNQIGTGATFTTPVLTQTTTYYVTVAGPTICSGAVLTGFPVTVIVNPRPVAADITITDVSICKGTATQLTATSSTVPNPVFNWYADAGLINKIFTGATYTTPVLLQNITLYITVSGTDVCENLAADAKTVNVAVTPNATAADITISDVVICTGNGATLTAGSTINNPIFNWYSDASLTNLLADNTATFTTPVLTGTTTYYITVQGAGICENQAGAAKTVSVLVQPTVPSDAFVVNNETICSGNSAQLSASTSIVSNPVFNWYSDPALTNLLTTGTTFNTGNLSVATNYYVTVSGSNVCESTPDRAMVVTVTVNNPATAADIQITDAIVCSGAGTILTASSTLVNPVFTWYEDAALTTVLKTGDTFTVPGITQTTTYYITVSGDNVCANNPTNAKAVTVSVEQIPEVTITSVPLPENLFIGSSFTLTANVNGSYAGLEWYKDGMLIPGASNQATLTFANFQASDQGFYQVEVITANGCRSLNRERGLAVVLSPADFATWKLGTDSNADGVARENEELTYTIHVKNTGSRILKNIFITDPLPANTSYVSGGTFDGINISLTDTDLAIDEERTYTFVVRAADVLTGITSISNQATVTADGEDKLTSCSADVSIPTCKTEIPATVTVNDFSTWKLVTDASGDGKVQAGEELTYTIHVKNIGNVLISNITITDSLPKHTTYVSGGSLAGSAVIFTDTDLAVDEERSYVLTVKASTVLNGVSVIINQATVNGNGKVHPTSCSSTSTNCTTDMVVDSNIAFVVPNVFTPNGDGINDVFKIEGLENYPGSKLLIFNRWGNEVYRSNNYQNDWDGSQLEEGVYFYILRLNSSDVAKNKFSGYIELIRAYK